MITFSFLNEDRTGDEFDAVSGMKSQFFRNITSLQEVECSGGELQSEVKLLFLKMIKLSDSSVLAFVNPQSHECLTYEEFSSCVIDAVDSKKTRLKILVSDLEEGESRLYGCIATTVKSHDFTQQITWNLTVRGRESVMIVVIFIFHFHQNHNSFDKETFFFIFDIAVKQRYESLSLSPNPLQLFVILASSPTLLRKRQQIPGR